MNAHSDAELQAFGERLGRFHAVAAPTTLRRELRRAVLTRELPRRAPLFSFARLRPALAVAVVVLALVTASGVAAASSLAGDPAFALKRGVEQVQLALSSSDAARVEVLVEQSDRRLGELQVAVAQRPAAVAATTREYDDAVAALAQAVARLASASPSGERDAALAAAARASETHERVLSGLLDRVPDEAKPGIQKAIEAQNDVHGKSRETPSSAPGVEPSSEPSARPSDQPARSTPPRPSPSPSHR